MSLKVYIKAQEKSFINTDRILLQYLVWFVDAEGNYCFLFQTQRADNPPSVPLWTYPLERGGMSCWWLPASELL